MAWTDGFNTDPAARGWIHEGLQNLLAWSGSKLAIGGLFQRNPNQSDRFVKPIATFNQDDSFEWNGDVNIILTQYAGADFGRIYFGFCNSADINADGIKNKIAVTIHRKILNVESFYALVIDDMGNSYFSAVSVVNLSTIFNTDTNWSFEAKYDGITKTFTIDLYNNTHAFVETLTVVLGSTVTFEVDRIGVFNREASTPYQTGWLDNLYFAGEVRRRYPPIPIRRELTPRR